MPPIVRRAAAQPAEVVVDAAKDGRPLVLFDAVCGLCNNFVSFVTSIDAEKFRFEPLQSPIGLANLRRHGLPEDLTTVVLIDGGKHYVRSAAALNVMWLLGIPWSILYAFIVLPTGVRDGLYKWVAANRYSIFGKVGVGNAEGSVSDVAASAAEALVAQTLRENTGRVIVFSKTTCGFCRRVKALLSERVDTAVSPLVVVEVDTREDGPALQLALHRRTGSLTVPQVFVSGAVDGGEPEADFLGGCDDVKAADASGDLVRRLQLRGVAIAGTPHSRL